MQSDRLEHSIAKQRPQERQREILVQVVDTPLARRLALKIEQMPQVVQKRGANECFVGASLLGQCRRLQRVLELRDRFATIGNGAVGVEEMPDVSQRERHDSSPG